MAVTFHSASSATAVSTASTTVNFPAPGIVTAGDVWICWAAFRLGSSGTISGVPASFTLIAREDAGSASSNSTIVAYWYVATGSETAGANFASITLSASSKQVTGTTALSGASTTSPIAGTAQAAGTVTVTTPALAAASSAQLAFAVFGQQGAANQIPSSTTPALIENGSATSGGSGASNVGGDAGYLSGPQPSQTYSAAAASASTMTGLAMVIAAGGTTNPVTVSATALTSASVAFHKAFGRTVSATVSTSVGLARSIAHVVKATPATTVSIARAITKTPISATVTTAAGVTRSVGKIVKATATTAASVAASKAKNITVAATVATSAAVKRTVSHAVSASASTAAKVTRVVGHTVSATAATAAKVSRVVSHTVSTTVTTAVNVAAVLGSSAIHITVSATVSTSVALSRVISRLVSATASSSVGLIFSKLFPGFFHVCVEVVANLFGRGSVSNRNSGAGSVSARVTTSNGPQSSITAKPQAPNRIGES